jgi:hypothetical protein
MSHFSTLYRMMLLAVLGVLVGCTAAQPKNIKNVCEMYDEYYSWYQAAKHTEKKWGVPPYVIMAFVHQESKFIADARPPRERFLWIFPGSYKSSAYGYAQALDGTWDEYREKTDNWSADRDEFEDVTDFIGWYNHKTYKRNKVKKDDAYSLYLAYHEGQGGYSRKTYAGKPWLLKVAKKVQRRSNQYKKQYHQCEKDLDRGWFWRTFF